MSYFRKIPIDRKIISFTRQKLKKSCCLNILFALFSDPGKSPTVLLLQPYKNPESRTYSFYNSVKDCMEAIIDTFEQKLKKEYPPTKYPDINYHLGNLYAYIEQFEDINCLGTVK